MTLKIDKQMIVVNKIVQYIYYDFIVILYIFKYKYMLPQSSRNKTMIYNISFQNRVLNIHKILWNEQIYSIITTLYYILYERSEAEWNFDYVKSEW